MATAVRAGEWDVLSDDRELFSSRLEPPTDAPTTPGRRVQTCGPAMAILQLDPAHALRAEFDRRTRALAGENEELQRIIDAIPHAIAILGTDGRILGANGFALDYTGFTLEELRADGARVR